MGSSSVCPFLPASLPVCDALKVPPCHNFMTELYSFSRLNNIPGRRRKWPPTPVFLPGESRGRGRLVGYGPCDRKGSDTTEHIAHTQYSRAWPDHTLLSCKLLPPAQGCYCPAFPPGSLTALFRGVSSPLGTNSLASTRPRTWDTRPQNRDLGRVTRTRLPKAPWGRPTVPPGQNLSY